MHIYTIDESRINKPQMRYYREIYKNSKRWNGFDSLKEKKVIYFAEQGNGDIIHFLRFIPELKKTGCYILAQLPKSLHRLAKQLNIDECFDKSVQELPIHDYHILSLSLQRWLKCPVTTTPYIHIKEKEDLSEFKGLNVGIAWEGNPEYEYNNDRNCPMKYFKVLEKLADRVNFFFLKPIIHDKSLWSEDFSDLYSVPIIDYYDTAKLINSLDLVVSVDTSVMHLSAAMGKETYGILGTKNSDPRWNRNWYDSLKLFKKKRKWETVFGNILKLRKKYES